MPRVSVLIPAYNVEKYVAEAVSSALAQTLDDVEVIVVNDGSTDGTVKALSPFMDKIVYIEQDNSGLSAARNAALRASSGTLVALLDADDVWMPQRLERMVDFMQQRGGRFATSDSYLIVGDRPTGGTYYGQWPRRRRFRASKQSYWITQYNFIHVMTVVHRDVYEMLGVFDERLRAFEDWELWMRFVTGGERVDYLDEPLGYYRIRPGSLSFDTRRAFQDQETMFEVAESKFGPDSPPGLRARRALASAKAALVRGENKDAQKWFAEASRSRGLPVSWKAVAAVGALAPRMTAKMFSIKYPAIS